MSPEGGVRAPALGFTHSPEVHVFSAFLTRIFRGCVDLEDRNPSDACVGGLLAGGRWGRGVACLQTRATQFPDRPQELAGTVQPHARSPWFNNVAFSAKMTGGEKHLYDPTQVFIYDAIILWSARFLRLMRRIDMMLLASRFPNQKTTLKKKVIQQKHPSIDGEPPWPKEPPDRGGICGFCAELRPADQPGIWLRVWSHLMPETLGPFWPPSSPPDSITRERYSPVRVRVPGGFRAIDPGTFLQVRSWEKRRRPERRSQRQTSDINGSLSQLKSDPIPTEKAGAPRCFRGSGSRWLVGEKVHVFVSMRSSRNWRWRPKCYCWGLTTLLWNAASDWPAGATNHLWRDPGLVTSRSDRDVIGWKRHDGVWWLVALS